jgi:hypothetical protein
MERKTALATAAAITMGVTSALFAVGAGTGLFGSAATAPAPAVQAASNATNATKATATNTATSSRHSDDKPQTSSNQTQSRGESDD